MGENSQKLYLAFCTCLGGKPKQNWIKRGSFTRKAKIVSVGNKSIKTRSANKIVRVQTTVSNNTRITVDTFKKNRSVFLGHSNAYILKGVYITYRTKALLIKCVRMQYKKNHKIREKRGCKPIGKTKHGNE